MMPRPAGTCRDCGGRTFDNRAARCLACHRATGNTTTHRRRRAKRTTSRKTPSQRFWVNVEITDTCWLWTAFCTKPGYGKFWDGTRKVLAHRWVYETCVEPIPAGITVDHLCFVTNCVNPDHLRLLTRPENCGNNRKSLQTHCLRGHEFDVANTYIKGNGTRRCLACQKLRASERWRLRKEAIAMQQNQGSSWAA